MASIQDTIASIAKTAKTINDTFQQVKGSMTQSQIDKAYAGVSKATNDIKAINDSGAVKRITSGGGAAPAAPATPTATDTQKTEAPTVITDNTIRNDVIPDITSKLNALSETGQYYDQNGNLHNADGSISDANTGTDTPSLKDSYTTPDYGGYEKSAAQDSQNILDTLDKLRSTTDSNTSAQISAIKESYSALRDATEEANRREQASFDTSMLMGGSSQYAVSTGGLVSAKIRSGIMELAQLNAQEASEIAKARQDQADQNYQIASLRIKEIESIRQRKLDKADEIRQTVEAENKAMIAANRKSSVENAIAGLYLQGIKDPATMLNYLSYYEDGTPTNGGVTLDDIKSALAIIDPQDKLTGLSSDYQTYEYMKKHGEIPSTWTLFDYQRAVKNATTKGVGGGSGTAGDQFAGFDFQSAKIADVKDMVRQLFPGANFADQLILNMTDEQLRSFMEYYQNLSQTAPMSFDPTQALTQWYDDMHIKPKGAAADTQDADAAKIDALLGE